MNKICLKRYKFTTLLYAILRKQSRALDNFLKIMGFEQKVNKESGKMLKGSDLFSGKRKRTPAPKKTGVPQKNKVNIKM